MPRTVEITVPSDQTDPPVADLEKMQGLLSLSVQRGTSLKPKGDVITLQIARRALSDLMQMLDQRGLPRNPNVSIMTSQPLSIAMSSAVSTIVHDSSDSTWEEMEVTIAKETNMTANTLILMFASGVFAGVALATNSLDNMIATQALAPGFMPIARVSLGLVARSKAWQRGLMDVAKGYVALIAGTLVATLILRWSGVDVLGGKSYYLPEHSLINYWSSVTTSSVLVSMAAGVAGAILLYTERTILTLAVMIALALVPGAGMIGVGLGGGSLEVASHGLLRWGVDVVIVFLTALAVFRRKFSRLHNRRLWL